MQRKTISLLAIEQLKSMNNSWVKLYRKTVDNGIMKDHLAWVLFSWLLLNVDKDTGKKTVGRYMVCDATKINTNSYYKIVNRLEKKWQVIRTQKAKGYTEVWIVNWGKYQSVNSEEAMNRQSLDNKETTSRQRADNEQTTYTRIENREKRILNTVKYLINIPKEDLQEFTKSFVCTENQIISKGEELYDYCEAKSKKYANYKAFLRNALRRNYSKRVEVKDYTPPFETISKDVAVKNVAKLKDISNKLAKGMSMDKFKNN